MRRFCVRSVLRSVRTGGFFEILIEMIQNNKTDGRYFVEAVLLLFLAKLAFPI